MARTKDENFMLQLYEEALLKGDLTYFFDRYEVGHAIGLHARGVEAICKTLLRTNFIKQDPGNADNVCITPHGIKLVNIIKDNE